MRRIWVAGAAAVALFGGLYLINASWLAPARYGKPALLANRGVAQHFSHVGLTNSSCTARMIFPPTHDYLENTIRSIRETFGLGADIVEVQIHPTTDGQFAVFHDWTLECRTNGHGVTREQSMAYLKTLDIGYGYTADGGKTYPFRGKGVGQMPSLDEVFAAFPGKRFVLMIKSNSASEGEKLAARLARLSVGERRRILIFSGGPRPAAVIRTRLPDMRVLDAATLKSCLLGYAALGWAGYVPASCHHSVILVPANYTWLLPGWPNRFLERMDKVDAPVFLAGPLQEGDALSGIDTPEQLRALPPGFTGGIWTYNVETIAPLLRGRSVISR